MKESVADLENQGIKAFLETHLNTLRLALGADALSVYARDEKNQSATLLAFSGEEPRQNFPYTIPPVGTCAKTGKGLLIERKHEDRPDKYASLVVVPLKYEEFLLGVLYGASIQSNFFKNEENLTKLRSIAEHLGKTWVQPISGGQSH